MVSEHFLHNIALKKRRCYNISLERKASIAHSNGYLCLPTNEKLFNFTKIKLVNKYKKHAKKSSYHTIFLKRNDETDRMKKERHIGNKIVRSFLKKETKKIISDCLF